MTQSSLKSVPFKKLRLPSLFLGLPLCTQTGGCSRNITHKEAVSKQNRGTTRCLLGPANNYKMQDAKIKHDFYSCHWGEHLFGETKSPAVTSALRSEGSFPRGSPKHLLQHYRLCNGSPLPQGVTSLITFNRIQTGQWGWQREASYSWAQAITLTHGQQLGNLL